MRYRWRCRCPALTEDQGRELREPALISVVQDSESVYEPGAVDPAKAAGWPRQRASKTAAALWWTGMTVVPCLSVIAFIEVWLASERACSGSGYNSPQGGLSVIWYLLTGLPLAYGSEGLALLVTRRRSRLARASVALLVMALAVAAYLAWEIATAGGPRCPSGVPGWWPAWIPHRTLQ